jgi:hypothetical protein
VEDLVLEKRKGKRERGRPGGESREGRKGSERRRRLISKKEAFGQESWEIVGCV